MIGARMGMCDPSIALMMCGILCKASTYFVSFFYPWWMNIYDRCKRGEKNQKNQREKTKEET
jgi:hypothetical protein